MFYKAQQVRSFNHLRVIIKQRRLLTLLLLYLTAMDFQGALNCLANGPDGDLSQAARQMATCGIDVRDSDNAVVLLPNAKALQGKYLHALVGRLC